MSRTKPMKPPAIALGIVLAGMAMGHAAFAQDSSMQNGSMQNKSMSDQSMMQHDKMMGHDHMSKMFDAMDTNHDGYISQSEHAAYMDAMFKKMDTNGDGKISKEEMQNGMKMHHDTMPGGMMHH